MRGGCIEQSPKKDCSDPTSPTKPSVTNISAMLRGREGNLAGTGRFTRAQRAHVTAFRSTPMEAVQQVDRKRSRVYNGRFSRSGALFVGEESWLSTNPISPTCTPTEICCYMFSPALVHHLLSFSPIVAFVPLRCSCPDRSNDNQML